MIAFFVGLPGRAVPERVETDADGSIAALVQSQLALATDNLARNEYERAIAHADAALAVVPDEAEALRIREAAEAALDRLADEPSSNLEQVTAAPPQVACMKRL